MWPSPRPTEPLLTSSIVPRSKPAAATTVRRVFARTTTPGITQRSSSTRTETTSKRSSTVTAECQPRDARLCERSRFPCVSTAYLAAVFDDRDQLVEAVALTAGEVRRAPWLVGQ